MVVAGAGHHTRQTVRIWQRRGDTTTERTAPDPALITVKAALRLPQLRRGRPEVVAGGAHLDNAIRWAHAGEVPDMATLLKGGELLLTTGMGVGRTATEQR